MSQSDATTRSESFGEVGGHGNVTLEECQLLRLLAEDFHYGHRELAEVIGRKPRTVRRHVLGNCGHGGRFW